LENPPPDSQFGHWTPNLDNQPGASATAMSAAGDIYGHISSGNLQALTESIPLSPEKLSLGRLVLFINLASKLKDDIILTQSAHIPASEPPDNLPPSVLHFLADCCEVTLPDVIVLWRALKGLAWYGCGPGDESLRKAFRQHGHAYDLCIYPIS
jgi:hypothetical protein